MVTLSAALSPISPDHLSNWYPSEGTAVNVTTVPLLYVAAAHSGGSYVKLPPCAGVLTTVSLYVPQAHIVVGVAEDTASAAHATTTATSQNSLNFLINFTPFPPHELGLSLIILHPQTPGLQ
jgi:hypothetical protein